MRKKATTGKPSAQTPTRGSVQRAHKATSDREGGGQPGTVIRSVPAVRRASAILWLLAEGGAPMGLTEIAREIDIFPSTCLHILREMAASRLIHYDQDLKTYSLGQGIVDLAQIVIHYDNFSELARPHLLSIANRFGVTAVASSEVDLQHIACVAVAKPIHSASLNVILGGKVPLYAGATGRCVAAVESKPRAQLMRHFSRIRWQKAITFDEWLHQIRQTKELGYGEDDGYFTRGVTTLATPIASPNSSVRRTIGIVAISAQLDDPLKSEIAEVLKTSAIEIATRLGN